MEGQWEYERRMKLLDAQVRATRATNARTHMP